MESRVRLDGAGERAVPWPVGRGAYGDTIPLHPQVINSILSSYRALCMQQENSAIFRGFCCWL